MQTSACFVKDPAGVPGLRKASGTWNHLATAEVDADNGHHGENI